MITKTLGTGKRAKHSKTLILLPVVCLLCLTSLAEDVPLWSKGIFYHPEGGFGRADRFSLTMIQQEGLHLTGQGAYGYYAPQKKEGPVTIEGTKTAGGVFWPDVSAEVKNRQTGQWETISKSMNVPGYRASITVKPGEYNPDLFVSLDVFQPLIGKYDLGRVALSTGDAAVFELKDLLPPSNSTAEKPK